MPDLERGDRERVLHAGGPPPAAAAQAGVLVTLNTDDPALTDLDLAREYAACAGAWGWTFDQMTDLALDGVEATWLDDEDQRALSARIRAEAARIGTSITPA